MFCSLFLDTKQFVLRLLPQTVEDDDLQQETVVINRKNLLETLTLKLRKLRTPDIGMEYYHVARKKLIR